MSAPQHIIDSVRDWVAERPLAKRERDELFAWARREMRLRRERGSEYDDDDDPEEAMVQHIMDVIGFDDEFGEDGDLFEAVWSMLASAGWPWA